jgi:hypothetical protein
VTEKSEAIACARICWSFWVNRVVVKKRIIGNYKNNIDPRHPAGEDGAEAEP